MASWIDAQQRCESHNYTLLQYTEVNLQTMIRHIILEMAYEFAHVMFLGLKRNEKVRHIVV